jgi:hypothetical protein
MGGGLVAVGWWAGRSLAEKESDSRKLVSELSRPLSTHCS